LKIVEGMDAIPPAGSEIVKHLIRLCDNVPVPAAEDLGQGAQHRDDCVAIGPTRYKVQVARPPLEDRIFVGAWAEKSISDPSKQADPRWATNFGKRRVLVGQARRMPRSPEHRKRSSDMAFRCIDVCGKSQLVPKVRGIASGGEGEVDLVPFPRRQRLKDDDLLRHALGSWVSRLSQAGARPEFSQGAGFACQGMLASRQVRSLA
jgi:hypothetical protein